MRVEIVQMTGNGDPSEILRPDWTRGAYRAPCPKCGSDNVSEFQGNAQHICDAVVACGDCHHRVEAYSPLVARQIWEATTGDAA